MKVAAVQMDVKILALEYNLERILARLEEAAAAGAKPDCVS